MDNSTPPESRADEWVSHFKQTAYFPYFKIAFSKQKERKRSLSHRINADKKKHCITAFQSRRRTFLCSTHIFKTQTEILQHDAHYIRRCCGYVKKWLSLDLGTPFRKCVTGFTLYDLLGMIKHPTHFMSMITYEFNRTKIIDNWNIQQNKLIKKCIKNVAENNYRIEGKLKFSRLTCRYCAVPIADQPFLEANQW